MAQSLSAVYLHVVFSTKSRIPFFADKELRTHLHGYLAGISRKLDCPTLLVGGEEDHVHLLARHARTISQADWIKELKRASSLWIKSDHPGLRDFAWQSGYGVFSVSISQLDKVQEYISNKEEHHRKQSFQDEYRAMLKKHRVDWAEKYVWN